MDSTAESYKKKLISCLVACYARVHATESGKCCNVHLMGVVHDIIETKGEQAALFGLRATGASSKPQQVIWLMRKTASVSSLGPMPSSIADKQLPDTTSWQIKSDHITLIVDPEADRAVGKRPSQLACLMAPAHA